MKLLLAACLVASLFWMADANLYQTCSLSLTKSGYNYTYPEVGALHQPFSEAPYSFAVNGTTTLYFNVCGGTSRCDGALACLVSDTGAVTPIVFGNERPSYETWTPYGTNATIVEHTYNGENGRFYTEFLCDPTTPFQIASASGHMDDDDFHITVHVNTSHACTPETLPPFSPPAQFDNLVGDLYMAGKLPMFSFDEVASADGYSMFEGKFYYSRSLGSIKLNGTLSNRKGATSQVGYIVQSSKNQYGDPPLSVSYVSIATLPEPVCLLLEPLVASDYSSWGVSPVHFSPVSFSPVSPISPWTYTFAADEESAASSNVFNELVAEYFSPVTISLSPVSPVSFGYDSREKSHLDWFSSEVNKYQGPKRNYTNIYFNKGTTFEVDSWAGSDARWGDRPFVNMMQRATDGLPVFLGTSLLAPFTPEDEQEFISEVNPDTLNFSTVLPASVFDPPAEWHCKL